MAHGYIRGLSLKTNSREKVTSRFTAALDLQLYIMFYSSPRSTNVHHVL